MTSTWKLAAVLLLYVWPLGSSIAAEPDGQPVEIVVTDRQPGPPLWKVSNGDQVLWIFPYLTWIPKDMFWENDRVARILAESQEFLELPQVSWTSAPLVQLNPVNLLRNERLNKRLDRNPHGGTLEENLPAALYARFVAVRMHYWPGSKDGLSDVRPQRAGQKMMNAVYRREGLVGGDDILKTIQRLAKRNRDIKHTEIEIGTEIDNFSEYAKRVEAVYATLPRDQELACFEQQVRHMEEDLEEMKRLANDWARGDTKEFRNFTLVSEVSNVCNELFKGSQSPEHETFEGMFALMNQAWLAAAENALTSNASTFAILPINELISEDGLLSKLRAKGYEIREP